VVIRVAVLVEHRLVGWLEFNVPFQHKYGYIRDKHRLVTDGRTDTRRQLTPALASVAQVKLVEGSDLQVLSRIKR